MTSHRFHLEAVPPPDATLPEIRTRELEMREVRVLRMEREKRDPTFYKGWEESLWRNMEYELKGFVLEEKGPVTETKVEMEYWATWFDHFKATFPGLCSTLGLGEPKRKKAVKICKLNQSAWYPTANVDVPKLGRPVPRVEFMVLDG